MRRVSPSGTARHILKLLKNCDVLVVLPGLVAELDALLHLGERVLEHLVSIYAKQQLYKRREQNKINLICTFEFNLPLSGLTCM